MNKARITADDWGFSPGVNEGILELAKLGVVSNVAVAVNMPFWKNYWKDLLSVEGVEISLHLNFCFGPSIEKVPSLINPRTGEFYNLSQFALRSLMGKVSPEDLQKETQAQIDLLQSAMNSPLRTINGHQHCHLVPGVMKAILPILIRTEVKRIRLPWDHQLWRTSKMPIMILSLLAKRQRLTDGIEWEIAKYPLGTDWKSTVHLKRKLMSSPQSEFFVHPARKEDFNEWNVADPYCKGRRHEFEVLKNYERQLL